MLSQAQNDRLTRIGPGRPGGDLRCLYRGWLYDVEGRCLAQPNVPAAHRFADKVRLRASPCREVGGLILAYLGPGEPPLVPAYEPLLVPDANRVVRKYYAGCS